MAESQAPHSSGHAVRAVRNSGYAILEFAWPVVLALVVTPFVVRGLGADAYGVFSIVAVTLGFFGLLDLGIGGAATKAIAQHVQRGELVEARRVLGTLLTAYLVIGIVGGGLLALLAPLLVTRVLTVPLELQPVALSAFLVSAVGFPVSLLVGASASVLKASQRFDLSTRVALVFSTAGSAATLGAVLGGAGLVGVTLASLALNLVACLVYFRVGRRLLGGESIPLGIDRQILRSMAGFAGWFLVASIGVVVLYQLDKVLLGSLLSVGAVTYYVVPGNLANRIQGFLGAATQVVFPASAGLLAEGAHESVGRLYRDGTRLTALLGATLAVPMAVFAQPFLGSWMGPEFGERSALVMVLLVGTYVLLGLTGVVWGLAFGAGHAKANALFVIGMGSLDTALLLALVGPFGIVGAAIAYLVAALVGVPPLIIYVERRILHLPGYAFLQEYLRVVPAVVAQLLLGLGLRLVGAGLLVTVLSMGVTAVALPVLYFALRLATERDRELVRRLAGRFRPAVEQGSGGA